MTCIDVTDLVEAIAAGDVVVNEATRVHLESCPACAGRLASARRLEAMLAADVTPIAPPRFTAQVLTKIRRERWQSEQRVDRIFNVAIAVACLLVVGGAAALLNLSGLIGLSGSVWGLLAQVSGQVASEASRVLLTYVTAAGLLVSALGMWWWAERRLSW